MAAVPLRKIHLLVGYVVGVVLYSHGTAAAVGCRWSDGRRVRAMGWTGGKRDDFIQLMGFLL